MRRVAVFIDWQNAYQQARAAFGLVGSGHEGQFSPLRLGQLLAVRNRRGRDGRLVRLAACAIEWSVVHRIDTVIVVSHDSDLRPAIEVLARIRSPAAVETASWRSPTYFKRIAPCPGVVNHTLSSLTLQSIADPQRYGALARKRLEERERARSQRR